MKKKQQGYKMYVVRSHIKARTLSEARRIAIKSEPQEIWISEDWKEGKNRELASAIGFEHTESDGEEDEE